jgi:hypothetical protein
MTSFVVVSSMVATVTAQTVVAELTDEVRVAAQANLNSNQAVLAAGPITAPRSANAMATWQVFASASLTHTLAPIAQGARWSSLATSSFGRAFTFCVSPESCGDLLVRAPGATVGSVVVTASGGGGSGNFWVDVGGDGSREIAAPFGTMRRDFRVCSASDLAVRAHVSALLTTSGTESFDLTVEIVPGLAPVAVTAYGARCNADLVTVDRPVGAVHNLDFALGNAFPNALGMLIVGLARAQIPVQGCLAYTVPLVAFGAATNSLGEAAWSTPVPGVITGFSFQAQGLGFDAAMQLRASSGAEIAFRDCE